MAAIQIIQGIVAATSVAAAPPPPPPPPPPSYRSWTIEWWGKKLSPQATGAPRVFAVGVDTGASFGFSNESGGDYVWTNGFGLGPITVGSIANAWHHWAIVSDASNLYFFKDGVLIGSDVRKNAAITDASTAFYLGGDTSQHWKGRIADFHIMKGVAKYTSNFTPPGRLASVESGTVFLQACDGSLITGPGAEQTAFSNVADDPWSDGFNSFEFAGNTGSFIKWTGNSIFALDAA